MEKNKPVKGTKKKSNWKRFWIICGVLIVINAGLVALALNWVYGVVSDYEQHYPSTALTKYFSDLFDGGEEEIKRTSSFTPDANSTWDDYLSILRSRFARAEEDYSFRLTASASLAKGEELYAIYSGEDKLGEVILAPDDTTESGWAARSLVTYVDGYSIVAPPGVQVVMNGQPIPIESHVEVLPVRVEYYKGDDLTSIDIFSKLHDQSLPPVLYRYETQQTLAEPTFTATAPNGEPTVQVDTEHRSVLVLPPLTAEQEQLATSTMETVAKAYSDFITEDGTLNNLMQYVYSNTDLNTEFREYQRGWYLDHEKREFSEFAFSSIAFHSDTCFTGHVDFDTYITFRGDLRTFEASYDMAFMLLDDKWQLVGIHARSGNGGDEAQSTGEDG